jgi:flagellin
MRELALQSRNDSNTDDDRVALEKEFQSMTKELDRIAASTQLNNKNLLDGSTTTALTFQVGSNSGSDNQISITLTDAMNTTAGGALSALNSQTISGVASDIEANFSGAITAIDDALKNINTTRADLGAVQNRLTSTIANLQNINENAEAARGRVQDTDFAAETLQQASTSVLAQANQLPSAVLKLLQ